jgi:magnesium transporter
MPPHSSLAHMHEPVTAYMRTDVPILEKHWTVQDALDHIRGHGIGERIVYFYVVDPEKRLLGVLPSRRLLTSSLQARIGDLMITRLVTIAENASVFEACEFFVLYKFLALPVVDSQRRMLGVLDVTTFTQEITDLGETEQLNQIFETIGYRVSEVRNASPLRVFRIRFPWLLATITSGTICALIAGLYAHTISEALVLAFFLTLVLGLGESVSVQSMTMTIQALHSMKPTTVWYLRALRKEILSSFTLGLGSGLLVGMIVWLWRGDVSTAGVIGGSILGALMMACLFGLSVPSILHALGLDVKIAAGPLTLALADISTLLIYFTAASIFL